MQINFPAVGRRFNEDYPQLPCGDLSSLVKSDLTLAPVNWCENQLGPTVPIKTALHQYIDTIEAACRARSTLQARFIEEAKRRATTDSCVISQLLMGHTPN